jgi:hypothetical protein
MVKRGALLLGIATGMFYIKRIANMSVNNDYREARKKEIMDILLSNPNQSLLLLKLLPEKDLITLLETTFEKHILPRFGQNAPDAFVYKMMELAYFQWKHDYDIEKTDKEVNND